MECVLYMGQTNEMPLMRAVSGIDGLGVIKLEGHRSR